MVSTRWRLVFTALALPLLVGVIVAWHCTHRSPGRAALSGLAIFGYDASGGFANRRPATVESSLHLIPLLADDDFLTVFRVDCDCQEIYSDFVPASTDKFALSIIPQLSLPARAPGTLPGAFLVKAQQRVNSAGKCAAVICFWSDGDIDDDHDYQSKFLQAARQLSQDKRVVAVCVYGINADSREKWRVAFSSNPRKLILHDIATDNAGDAAELLDAAKSEGEL